MSIDDIITICVVSLKLGYDSFRLFTFKQIVGFIDYYRKETNDQNEYLKVLAWETTRFDCANRMNWSGRSLKKNKIIKPVDVIKFTWDADTPDLSGVPVDKKEARDMVLKKFKIYG